MINTPPGPLHLLSDKLLIEQVSCLLPINISNLSAGLLLRQHDGKMCQILMKIVLQAAQAGIMDQLDQFYV